jgi:hypothetical protein
MRSLATLLLLTKREKSELGRIDAKSGRLQNLQKINLIYFNVIWLQMQHFVHWNFL